MNINLFSESISKIKNKSNVFNIVEKVESYFLPNKSIVKQTPHLAIINKGLLCELHNRKKSLEISFYEDKISYLKIDNKINYEQKGLISSKEDFVELMNWYFI